jgi:TfoX/Sxy family transcriptional regulator of competence genes
MAWVKIPAEHHPLFRAALPKDPRIQTLNMFGGVAAKIDGKMFAGLFARSAIVRLTGADYDEAVALDGAEKFDPMGRGPSKDMVLLPEDVFEDHDALRAWLVRAMKSTAATGTTQPAAKASRSKRRPAAKPNAAAAAKRPRSSASRRSSR